MSFLQPIFFLFLPAVWIGYRLLRGRSPRSAFVFLWVSSCCFYAYLVPVHLTILLGLALFAFGAGILLARFRNRRLLLAGVAVLLAPLFVYKYYDFFQRSLGVSADRFLHLALPLGISFFTFQNISYVTSVYRGQLSPSRDLVSYMVYITFFPQLVAGPIVTAAHFLPQLKLPFRPELRLGAFFLMSGYVKKVFADQLAVGVDAAFGNPEVYSGAGLLVAALAYSLQIYFDFSGYSDMAIGLGRLFGFELPENFRFPYSAVGVRDFWRRWHTTLSTWLRDQLYIPMGGSRHGRPVMAGALMATMLLGGLWHGADWNFVVWGGLHGALLIGERFLPNSWFSLLWIFFRTGSGGFEQSLLIYSKIFCYEPGLFSDAALRWTVLGYGGLLLASIWYEGVKGWFLSAPPTLAGFVAAPGSEAFIYFIF